MDIRNKLTSGHSKAIALAIVDEISDHPGKFDELMEIFLEGDYRMTQRAAWPFGFVAEKYPGMVIPYMSRLIALLSDQTAHPAITRNILRAFQNMRIPEQHHGTLVDLCFGFIMNENFPVAIRAFAITTASRICVLYPDLSREFEVIIAELSRLPQSAAIRVRIRSALKALREGIPSR